VFLCWLQDWEEKLKYSLGAYSIIAHSQNDSLGRKGQLWGMCLEMTEFAVVVPVIKGWVDVDEDGAMYSTSQDLDMTSGHEYVRQALEAVRQLPSCSGVSKLREGRYYIGDIYYSQVRWCSTLTVVVA
jgi:hypothetical protein